MKKFVVTKTGNNWHFVLKARNGKVILSSESYTSESGCLNGVEAVKECGSVKENFETRTSENGKDYFVLKANNGEIIGTSEMYESKAGMNNGIKSVMENSSSIN